jgi:hypothetical protein
MAPKVKLATSVALDPVHSGTLYLGTATGDNAWGGPARGSSNRRTAALPGRRSTRGSWPLPWTKALWALTVDPVSPRCSITRRGTAISASQVHERRRRLEARLPAGRRDGEDRDLGSVVAMDPANHLHCSSPCDRCKGTSIRAAWASKDGGATWRLFAVPTAGFRTARGRVHRLYYLAGAAGADGVLPKDSGGAAEGRRRLSQCVESAQRTSWDRSRACWKAPTVVRGRRSRALRPSDFWTTARPSGRSANTRRTASLSRPRGRPHVEGGQDAVHRGGNMGYDTPHRLSTRPTGAPGSGES